MKRFTVLGFTEAELGFVLAALFAAIAVSAAGTGADIEQEIEDITTARDSIAAARDSVLAQRDSIALAYAQFRDSVQEAESKRSTKTPQCWERGEPRRAIAELRVLGNDSYELDGTQLDFRGVRARLQPFLARSDSLNCRYIVIARSIPGIDAVDHTAAVWRLRSFFDVDDRAR